MSVIQTVVSKVASWLRRNKIRREIVVNVEKLETRVAVRSNVTTARPSGDRQVTGSAQRTADAKTVDSA